MDNSSEVKLEASGSLSVDNEAVKDLLDVDEKKEGSDDEEIEEERSWRRGYDAE